MTRLAALPLALTCIPLLALAGCSDDGEAMPTTSFGTATATATATATDTDPSTTETTDDSASGDGDGDAPDCQDGDE